MKFLCVVPEDIHTPTMEGFFFKLNPLPSGNSILVSYFHTKNWAFETPSPLEFPLTFHGLGMDIYRINYSIGRVSFLSAKYSIQYNNK